MIVDDDAVAPSISRRRHAPVAWVLLPLLDMNRHPTPWRPLVRAALSTVPAAAGAFEVATLVRNVRYIAAAAGNLRERLAPLADWQAQLPPSPGGYYFRYLQADHEQEALSVFVEAYRLTHGGPPPVMDAKQTARAEKAPQLREARRQAA